MRAKTTSKFIPGIVYVQCPRGRLFCDRRESHTEAGQDPAVSLAPVRDLSPHSHLTQPQARRQVGYILSVLKNSRKSLLHPLKYNKNLNLSRCSTNLR